MPSPGARHRIGPRHRSSWQALWVRLLGSASVLRAEKQNGSVEAVETRHIQPAHPGARPAACRRTSAPSCRDALSHFAGWSC